MRHNGPLGRNKVWLWQGNAESFQNFRVYFGLWAFLEVGFKNNAKTDSILNFSREKLSNYQNNNKDQLCLSCSTQ